MRADRRLYITARGQLVAEHDPEAAYMLAGKGQEIPAETAKRLDLWERDGRVMQGPEPEPEPEPEPVVEAAVVEPTPEPEPEEQPEPIMPPESRRSRKKL